MVVLVGAAVVEIRAHSSASARAVFVVIILLWLYFLLRGVRWIWIATVGISVLGLMVDLLSGSFTWLGLVMGVVALALLLLPATRRHFDVGSSRVA
jgi:hypothetical protein